MHKLKILASQLAFFYNNNISVMMVFVYRTSTNLFPVRVAKFILQDGEAVCCVGAL